MHIYYRAYACSVNLKSMWGCYIVEDKHMHPDTNLAIQAIQIKQAFIEMCMHASFTLVEHILCMSLIDTMQHVTISWQMR